MAKSTNELKIIRGDDIAWDVYFFESNGKTPVDITDAIVFFTVKKILDSDLLLDEDAVISQDIDDHTDPENGITTITLLAEDVNEIAPGEYFWDIQIKYDSGLIESIDYGKFIVSSDVTRRTA